MMRISSFYLFIESGRGFTQCNDAVRINLSHEVALVHTLSQSDDDAGLEK
jgi:hypothetical protein